MTFETWWKEHGSLQNDIFNLSFEAREIFKRISKTAWDESESLTRGEVAEYDERIDSLETEVDRLKEERKKALADIKTLKDSIRACL